MSSLCKVYVAVGFPPGLLCSSGSDDVVINSYVEYSVLETKSEVDISS